MVSGKISIGGGNGRSLPCLHYRGHQASFVYRGNSFVIAAPGDALARGVLRLDNSGKLDSVADLQLWSPSVMLTPVTKHAGGLQLHLNLAFQRIVQRSIGNPCGQIRDQKVIFPSA